MFYNFIKATYWVILLVYFDRFLIKSYTTCSGTRSRGVYRRGTLPVAVLVTEGGQRGEASQSVRGMTISSRAKSLPEFVILLALNISCEYESQLTLQQSVCVCTCSYLLNVCVQITLNNRSTLLSKHIVCDQGVVTKQMSLAKQSIFYQPFLLQSQYH